MEEPICPNGLNFHGKGKEEKTIPRGGPRSADFTEKLSNSPLAPDSLAETQGFEPWIQVLARMLP
jgi:hypothetical protein